MLKFENKVGLYLTIAVHLLIIIILLLAKISALVSEENSFVIDFSKQEQIEKEAEEIKLKEEISKELDEELSGQTYGSTTRNNIRNVIVDAGAKKGSELRDDRFKNPSQVYQEAMELQKKLEASKKEAEAYQGSDDVPTSTNSSKQSQSESYKGPSVLSYTLEGRKAISLPIPVYKCIAGGDVYISIIVNRKGYVVSASIIDGISANDDCIREYAIRAAKSSRFTASDTAPEKQQGEIVYRFIAQSPFL
ncbi:MAG TPA: hypothetical protein PLG03_01130 [Bacteroidales bacterium]|jgi:hypothetical protein|nr:hypothetical protein [Bacteroidales bacterium]HBZ35531.1 hypothetical protein [Rikenellaceae bacterium]HON54140.1 hypothetical protein [Bacteroidales bacterium]HRR48740.1 hypothetical protein [Bacteroidales bacterium]HRT32973.1 hypothetical protein [Bacteroidales bacterium]